MNDNRCPNCGAAVNASDAFCISCGKAIPAPAPQPQAPAWNNAAPVRASVDAVGKSRDYTIALMLGLASYVALILSFFLPYLGLKDSSLSYSASFIELTKLSSLFSVSNTVGMMSHGLISASNIVAIVFLIFCIITIIWLLIPKRWAAIIGAVWCAIIVIYALWFMIVFGNAGSYASLELKIGALLMLIAGIIMLDACIMLAITLKRRRPAPASY